MNYNYQILRTVFFSLLCLISFSLSAQDKTISGKVTDAGSGEPLIGVNVVAIGAENVGSITDIDGNYTIKLPTNITELNFSYIGYTTQKVAIGSETTVNVQLAADMKVLDDVVVTAFGIEKSEKKLTYAVSRVAGVEFARARETNIANSLSGKVAGVQVNRPASGAGGSSRVVIRGVSSLGGNNQPLYVVDGIPIDNQNIGAAIQWGGIDYGDGVGGINPDDIEGMSVLKGPAASALYGSRAANGVILITTKKGKSQENGIGIEYNGNITFDSPLIYPDVQNEFGHGAGGKLKTDLGGVLGLGDGNQGSSWGPRMTGQQALFWDGTTRAYNSQPNNIKDFYQTGTTLSNTIALSGATDKAHFRLSYWNLDNKGIIPTSTLKRNGFTFRGGANLTDKLSVDAKVTYIKTDGYNRPNLAEIMTNPAHAFMSMPRSIDLANLKDYKAEGGGNKIFTSQPFILNPYWSINENINQDDKDRLIGNVGLSYKFNDWLSVEGRTGTDYYVHDRLNVTAIGTTYRPDAEMQKDQYRVREDNSYVMLKANKEVSEGINVSGMVGAARVYFRTERVGFFGSNFSVPFYVISNASSQQNRYELTQRELQSVFAQASLDYKNTLFLDVTARNDWSSTLPINNNSFFYPSVSASYAFTESLDIPENILTFGKLRVSWAQVGNDAAPYQLSPTYSFTGQTHLGQPLAVLGSVGNQDVPNYSIPLANLKPEQTASIEVGADLRFLNERLNLDVTWYKQNTSNQILQTTVSPTSGFGSAVINAGEMENSGFEIALRGTPVKLDNGFVWELGVNFAQNRNKVLSLTDGLDQLQLGDVRGTFVVARPNSPYGDIVGFGYKKDDNGNRIFDANGMPVKADAVEVLGNSTPDWLGGIVNTFSYKGVSLNTLIDIRQGGSIFSRTAAVMYNQGTAAGSVEGREAWYAGTGGFVGKGVNETGGANTVAVDPELYWRAISEGNIVEDFIYDASYVKLRELSISYQLPKTVLEKTKLVKDATVSFVGRNLFILSSSTPGFDPESNFNAGNAQGLESSSMPSTRSLGFNLSLRF